MSMQITYYGHSCFTLKCNGFPVAIDPYRDYVPGYRPLSIEAYRTFCSHNHDDHCWRAAVKLPEVLFMDDPFTIPRIKGYHDDVQGAKRGPNTMHIFMADGLKVAHLGDIGCFPPEEDLEKLKGLDACMVPVGGHYTIDAKQAKELMDILQPRVIIPMHYRLGNLGFAEIGTLDEFTSLYAPEEVTYTGTNSFELTKDSPEGVIVLQYQ